MQMRWWRVEEGGVVLELSSVCNVRVEVETFLGDATVGLIRLD